MKANQTAVAALGAGLAVLAVVPSLAGSNPFDPLFANGAQCAPARAGRPALLGTLMLAQKTETAPFTPAQQRPSTAPADMPPLYTNLGNLHMRASQASGQAQAYFDQGVRLMFAFNHAEAARAFRAAQHFSPNCAMCYWGEALVLGPNINAPMFPEAVAPAQAAVTKAQALAATATAPEQALIKALAARYLANPPADRAPLDQAYADAMTAVAHAYPNDDHIQVLYAESLMDLSPWDYWAAGGAQPKGRTADTVDALERVLERNPTHAGAMHYYIHTMEASTHPEKALPYARGLARQIPGAGHLVHMPSHIYYRVGLYKDALQQNLDAIAVDEKYFRTAASDPVYKGAYYPHNIHFVLVSALMGGDGKTALSAAGKLDKAISADLLKAVPPLQPVKSALYFAHVQFSDPETLVRLPDPGPDFPLVQGMWHYARAVGFARKGAHADSRKEIDAIAGIENTADLKPLAAWKVPAPEILHTARAVATGRLADARGDTAAAIKAYEDAVAIQDTLPYFEPPYWYYPVRQSLGVALLRAGRIDDAENVFRTSLAKIPSNGWALRGLMEVYRQRGDGAALAAAQKRFESTWLGNKGGPALALL